MNRPQPVTRLLSTRSFAPLELALDDRLEHDLLLVMGYRHRIDPERLIRALNVGLQAFPHLTGKLVRDEATGRWWIEPLSGPTEMEVADDGGPWLMDDLRRMSHRDLARHFLPETAASDDGAKRLFALRRTSCGGGDVLGLRVSHAAVDGTGLGWFARCCAAGAHGENPPPVRHDRREILAAAGPGPGDVPPGYCDAGDLARWQWPPDPWVTGTPVFFVIPTAAARRVMKTAGSLLDLRLELAAWLCHRLAAIAPQLNGVAVWCDPRGGGLVPRHFTGNAGCYHFLPLRVESATGFAASLKQLSGRSGLRRTAGVYRHLKQAEANGRGLVWDGPREDLLQLNLLPRTAADGGLGGPPDFSLLLSRNSSGLRVSVTPDDSGFLIEACLAPGWGAGLVQEALLCGLDPRVWNAGDQSNPGG